MSLPKRDVRTAICEEAHKVLRDMCTVSDTDIWVQAGVLLEEALLGKTHAIRLLVERATRLGKDRQATEDPGSPRKTAERR